MAVVLAQWFPLGRFHATRWNQNPFEDRFGEWPPSPWRLLRALAARWFQYQRETGDDNTEARDYLLTKLADEQPSFCLPPMTERHELRQYQPTALELQYKYRKDPKTKKNVLDYSYRSVTTTLVRDTYRVLARDDVLHWLWENTHLEDRQRALLAELLRRMHYFGRAESWTRFELLGDAAELPPVNCVLARELSDARQPVLVSHSIRGLIDVTLARTGDSIMSNRPVPPGTGWQYAKLPDRPTIKARIRPRPQPIIQVVRYAMDSTVLPLVTETLPVAEAARRALMSLHGQLTERDGVRGRSRVFSGKDNDGEPLAGHGHAFYLPADEDGDGRLDHLTVFAREGFGADERRAFDRLRRVNRGREAEARQELRVLLLDMSALDQDTPGPLARSAVWESASPYIATRYAKTRGRHRRDLRLPQDRVEFLLEDLREQMRQVLGIDPNAAHFEAMADEHGAFRVGERWRPIQFKRCRSKRSDDGGQRLAGAFHIRFDTAVAGPIALGHSSHFGMGLFMPGKGGAELGRG